MRMKVKASHVHTATLHTLGPVPRETETETERGEAAEREKDGEERPVERGRPEN